MTTLARFLASHPDLIEQVLLTDAKYYIKHFGARMYMPVLGKGLVTSEGDFWLRQRKLSQPAFLKNRVYSYAPMMGELTRKMVDNWKPGERVDIHFEFSSLTSAIALKTLFGEFIHELTGPVIPTVLPGVRGVHAVDAAGVHPLLLAIGSERYVPYEARRKPRELHTQAHAILGQGQLSLAKYLLIVARDDAISGRKQCVGGKRVCAAL